MKSTQTHDFDYIVIGSGFGGSVAALRLSEKGYRVAVIEKGKEWKTQDFPKTNWNIKKYLWIPQIGCYGYQMLTLFKHVMILHGSGVGGGSLVYANQLLVPPEEVFKSRDWCIENPRETLAPHYETAKKMLGANQSPHVGKADLLLQQVGMEMTGKDTFHKNDVSIFFGTPEKTVPDPYFEGKGPDRTGCTFCGACMIGCPVGAKNTLDKNYLFLARGRGAKIIPETLVTGVRKVTDGYEVITTNMTGFLKKQRIFRVKGVIFSGGVLGTVKLLSQCKDKGLLPLISEGLGNFVRTNSEALIGVKSNDKTCDWNDQIAITSGIYPDKTTHIEIVRYNKGSDVLLNLFTIMSGGGGNVPRVIRFLGNVARHPLGFLKLLWPLGKATSISVLLVMQTDKNHLKLGYKPRWWRLGGKSINSEVPEGFERSPSYIPVANETARRLAKKMDGIALSSFPEVLLNMSTTAHILGGCSMGKSALEGVVSDKGEVFNYPGLYVADGSVVSANLGVNPSLTITALSEHIMSKIPSKEACPD
ncbi:MAG: GMC family oxidoreductase [Proteobacteria bacterium]|nr:GMC family oxidoreductase [Desulfobacula sp.]MBU4132385.1 GMC family oxidoreductase [Pseudomonadota bacterium]